MYDSDNYTDAAIKENAYSKVTISRGEMVSVFQSTKN